jgi:hypothetical protein
MTMTCGRILLDTGELRDLARRLRDSGGQLGEISLQLFRVSSDVASHSALAPVEALRVEQHILSTQFELEKLVAELLLDAVPLDVEAGLADAEQAIDAGLSLVAIAVREIGPEAWAVLKDLGHDVRSTAIHIQETVAALMQALGVEQIHLGFGDDYVSIKSDGSVEVRLDSLSSDFSLDAKKGDFAAEVLGSGFSKTDSVFALMIGAPFPGGALQSITSYDTKEHRLSEEVRASEDLGGAEGTASFKLSADGDTGELEATVGGELKASGMEVHASVGASSEGTISASYGAGGDAAFGLLSGEASADQSIAWNVGSGDVTVTTSVDATTSLQIPFGVGGSFAQSLGHFEFLQYNGLDLAPSAPSAGAEGWYR